ncbi:hypothetical protein [Streptomyces sp. NBC_01462]|uniref:hypothetical protein n=1 Tax=Streptomyces sp. NBC_01462 TaxID=2903876 RepID=UPI002E31A226|nr:hypothetical protein [Streptomyces sp. NBC_01462]
MGGEIEAHGAVTGESSTSKGGTGPSPAPSTEDGFSWRRLAGQIAGAAVVVAVAADRLGLHFFLLLARFAVHAYSWLGLGN